MLNDKETKRISKFLSYVLRHHPELIGIELDQNGWTNVTGLIEKSNIYGVSFDENILKFVVATNTKKRFAFNETFDLIRANQGHSIQIDLDYKSVSPPEILFHGTSVKAVDSILKQGILKGERHHVHLSEDRQTAIQVGQRHGKPHVLSVLSGQMHRDGFDFFLTENGVWLTEIVSPKYITK